MLQRRTQYSKQDWVLCFLGSLNPSCSYYMLQYVFFSVCHAVRWYVKKQCCISCSICQSCRPVSHESIWLFIQFCLIRAGLLKPHLWFWPTGLSGEGHCWVSSVQTAVKTFDYWVFEWLKIYKLDFFLGSTQRSVSRICSFVFSLSFFLSRTLFQSHLFRNAYFKGYLDFRALLKVQSCSLLL